ncbi:OmpA family protein [Leptospira semungkisensis]|uniref:OmpA family protein n=2 Tax=Leptospira semungkisensis TaxID=2484985 RepID=A0A4V3JCP5_9LEPT|nr:OmpA family protein [Leptospira semungkisensis]
MTPKFFGKFIETRTMAFLRGLLLFLLLFPSILFSQDSVLLRWKMNSGDDLELNEYHRVRARQGQRVIHREDKNRILLKAVSCKKEGCDFSAIFDTYTKFPEVDPAFYKDKTFKSRFFISETGQYTVPPEYSMPNLRSLPSFSDKSVSQGDNWIKPASESFQFSGARIEIPVQAKYTYKGPEVWKYAGKSGKADLIEYNYNLMKEAETFAPGVPYKIYGFAKGQVFFDSEAGVPQYKHVQLAYTFVFPNGIAQEMTFEIHGVYSKQSSVSESDKDKVAEEVKKMLGGFPDISAQPKKKPNSNKGNGLEWPEWEGNPEGEKQDRAPVEIRKSNEGVVLSLDNLLFDYNKSELKPEAKKVLDKIADVLKKYPDREIRISGHTDDRGSQEYNLKLSQDRALSVLQELRDTHAIEETRMSYKGYGKSQPVSGNEDETGRAKNRRVDITIVLD